MSEVSGGGERPLCVLDVLESPSTLTFEREKA